MDKNAVAVIVAGAFLTLGLVLFFRGISAKLTFPRHSQLTFAWLCIALSASFALFSVFPSSTTQGSALGFTVGGAGAFVVLIWLAAFHIQRKLAEMDDAGSIFKPLPTLDTQDNASLDVIHVNTVYVHKIPNISKRLVCIATGNLRGVTGVDLWVNSENTDMQMSRMYERSISGFIRYEGSRLGASGKPLDDPIAMELFDKTRGMTPVEPGTAIATGSAELLRKNGVKSIIHVAAVRGEPTAGYRQLNSLDRCVVNVLDLAQEINASTPVQSILFPLLGAGGARGERAATARTMVSAVVNYLASNQGSCIRRVYFLARTATALAVLQAAFEEFGISDFDIVAGPERR